MITSIELTNLGTVNKNEVILKSKDKGDEKDITLTFSYQTIVQVASPKGIFTCQNDWSTTTGKLLNDLEPDHNKRIPHDKLMEKVDEALKGI